MKDSELHPNVGGSLLDVGGKLWDVGSNLLDVGSTTASGSSISGRGQVHPSWLVPGWNRRKDVLLKVGFGVEMMESGPQVWDRLENSLD